MGAGWDPESTRSRRRARSRPARGSCGWATRRPELSPASTRVQGIAKTVTVAGHPADIAIGSRSVWVTLALEDAVARIDPETGSVRSTIDVGRRPGGIAVGAGAVLVANSGDGTVSRLDPGSGAVTDTIAIGGSPQDVVVADRRVWVSVRPRSREVRERPGGTITMETQDDIDFLDPALAYEHESLAVCWTPPARSC